MEIITSADPHLLRYLPEPGISLDKTPKFVGGSIAVIRKEIVDPTENEADFKIDTGYGVTLYTDSSIIADQVEKTRALKYTPPTADFVYLTKKEISPSEKNELPPREMGKGHPGEILVTPDLKHYALSGPEKYGSVISTIMGIASLEKAEMGVIGLHAGLLYDKILDRNHVFIGGSGSGKSTYIQILSSQYPNRFTAITDDWIEIDTKKNLSFPISRAVGSRPDTLSKSILQKNPRVTESFDSFGKTFYIEKAPNSNPQIGKVFQLHTHHFEKTPSGYTQLLREVDVHIPFMSELHGNILKLPPSVNRKLLQIIDNYLLLTRQKYFYTVNTRSGDIDKTLGTIIEKINSK